jgi:hypothetical protein
MQTVADICAAKRTVDSLIVRLGLSSNLRKILLQFSNCIWSLNHQQHALSTEFQQDKQSLLELESWARQQIQQHCLQAQNIAENEAFRMFNSNHDQLMPYRHAIKRILQLEENINETEIGNILSELKLSYPEAKFFFQPTYDEKQNGLTFLEHFGGELSATFNAFSHAELDKLEQALKTVIQQIECKSRTLISSYRVTALDHAEPLFTP